MNGPVLDNRLAPAAIYEELAKLFEKFGDEQYGEAITQREHMLQSAHMAEERGESDAIVVAALLHDVGHFFSPQTEELVSDGRPEQNFCHEVLGARFLESCFGPEVIVPIQLHVAVKRYLCSVEEGYYESLSEASKHSLVLQGGPMTPAQVEKFSAGKHSDAAIGLRYCDDHGKQVGIDIPGLEYYRELIIKMVKKDLRAS
ncbi:MAG: putative HD phosphohydrolase [Marinobacter psychrophilus]